MNSALKHTIIAMATAALSVTAGCKSDAGPEASEATTGAETAPRPKPPAAKAAAVERKTLPKRQAMRRKLPAAKAAAAKPAKYSAREVRRARRRLNGAARYFEPRRQLSPRLVFSGPA